MRCRSSRAVRLDFAGGTGIGIGIYSYLRIMPVPYGVFGNYLLLKSLIYGSIYSVLHFAFHPCLCRE